MFLFSTSGLNRSISVREIAVARGKVNTRLTRPALLLLLLLIAFGSAGCNRTVLDERFYDPRLDHWTRIDEPDTIQGPSSWKVEKDGWLHQSSNIWGRRGDFLGRWYGTFLVAGDTSWKSYNFTLRARPLDNDGFGVVFRYQDSSHFYRLLFIQDPMSGGPLTRLDKRLGPDYTEIWSIRKGYAVGRELRISVDVAGERIQVSVDNSPLVQASDSAYASGKIGLFCFAQAGQEFSNVKVVLN